MIQGAACSGKDKIMHFRKIAAGAAAIMMALVCGCSVRSSSDAAWPTGKVSDKKALTVSYDAFSKEYKYWLLVNQIPDDTADEVKDKCRAQRESIINYLVNEKIVLEQAKNYGVDQFTDEELDSIESDYNSYIESSIESFRSYVNAGESGTGEVSGDAAILEEAEKIFDEKLTECGMTRQDRRQAQGKACGGRPGRVQRRRGAVQRNCGWYKAGLREQPRRLRAGLILQVLLAAG